MSKCVENQQNAKLIVTSTTIMVTFRRLSSDFFSFEFIFGLGVDFFLLLFKLAYSLSFVSPTENFA
jgi:hypothetical protein